MSTGSPYFSIPTSTSPHFSQIYNLIYFNNCYIDTYKHACICIFMYRQTKLIESMYCCSCVYAFRVDQMGLENLSVGLSLQKLILSFISS